MGTDQSTRRLWLTAGRASIRARARSAPEIDPAVVTLASSRYLTLASRVPWPSKTMLRFHLTLSVLPQVALYTSLLAVGWTTERALAAMSKTVPSSVPPLRRSLATVTRWRGGRAVFMWLAQRSLAGFPSPGWECRWIENSPTRVAFNLTRCFDLGVMRDLGVPELAPLFCAADDLLNEGVCPHLRWHRSGTLARGDRVCDFSFERTG